MKKDSSLCDQMGCDKLALLFAEQGTLHCTEAARRFAQLKRVESEAPCLLQDYVIINVRDFKHVVNKSWCSHLRR